MRLQTLSTAAFAVLASGSWTKNINYRSPSEHHPGLGVALHKVNKRNTPEKSFKPSDLSFTHGVASGDPYSDSVILWTRVSPQYDSVDDNGPVTGDVPLYWHGPEQTVSTAPICVDYQVSPTKDFAQVVDSGKAYTSSDVDYTVKVEATGLEAFTRYYYQFSVCDSNNTSPIGRTKTSPGVNDDVSQVNLAVYSCANYPFGYFNAYGNPVRKDSVDYVVHLGDYIYEYRGNGDYGNGAPIGRIPKPERVIHTLYDFRERYATYRSDLDLQLSHQAFPWIPTWDDHEVADNTYRDGAADLANNEASFINDGGFSIDQVKMNAVRAYFEWMPIRQVEMDDNLRIWRSFSIGKLFDLMMLDTRQYDRSITDLYWNTDYIHAIADDAGRTMMGSRQENWLYNELSASAARGAAWRLVGSQTVFARLNQSIVYGPGNPYNYDQWDGYEANRNRTLHHLARNAIDNTIVLSGDSHANWVSNLLGDYGDPGSHLGVEFAGTAITSPPPAGEASVPAANRESDLFSAHNAHLHWNEMFYRGYFELRITADELRAAFFGLPDIRTRNALEIPLANFSVRAGENRLAEPVGGGRAETGCLKGGEVALSYLTNDTETGQWFVGEPSQPVPHALYWVLAAGAGIVAVTIVLSFAITWSTRRARYMVLDGEDSG
ncbi:hypothetical protein WHR41_08566 [Cladosporium halotolerans]|uniref:Alkaline phosphatase n=1 Tax=Cladosporium halotolerans TaxID=1052096 RepID=A0AB34KC43_9PEZI